VAALAAGAGAAPATAAYDFGFTIANLTGNPVKFTGATKTAGRIWAQRGDLRRPLGYRSYATWASVVPNLAGVRDFVEVRVLVPAVGTPGDPGYRPEGSLTIRATITLPVTRTRQPTIRCNFASPHPVYECVRERPATVRRSAVSTTGLIYHYVIRTQG
jgi:hypothetical protein